MYEKTKNNRLGNQKNEINTGWNALEWHESGVENEIPSGCHYCVERLRLFG